MGVITISRQLGSQGNDVAQEIASRLNYPVVCRELINQAAIRAGVPEVALATIDDLGLFGLHPSPEARKAYHHAVQVLMEEFSADGDVIIVGRAGQVILRNHPGVLHVKVIAPASLRACRIANQQGISSKQLELKSMQATVPDMIIYVAFIMFVGMILSCMI